MKGAFWFFFIIIVVAIIWAWHRYDFISKEIIKEKSLVKQDEDEREAKQKIKDKRIRLRNLAAKSIICFIALSPYIWMTDYIEKIWNSLKPMIFTCVVLFYKSTDFLQVTIDNINKWLAPIFHGKLDKDINTIDLRIETRKNRIGELEEQLKPFLFFQSSN